MTRPRRLGRNTVLLLVLLALSPAVTAGRGAETPLVRLTILHTNDFHGFGPRQLSRRAALIARIRAREENLLLVDAGDVWTRGRYDEVFFGEMEFAAMNAMGYDVMTLGNNEFKGTAEPVSSQAHLFARIRQADFPVLCANIRTADGEYLPGVRPYIIKEIAGLKVGIFGVTAERTGTYRQVEGLTVADPVLTAAEVVPGLRLEADVVIALTHIGVKEDRWLARTVPGITAIVGGDSHTVLLKPVMVNGVPIVQAGSLGLYLGRLDLYLKKCDGEWVLADYHGELLPIDLQMPEDPEVRRIMDGFLARMKQAS